MFPKVYKALQPSASIGQACVSTSLHCAESESDYVTSRGFQWLDRQTVSRSGRRFDREDQPGCDDRSSLPRARTVLNAGGTLRNLAT
jgi:hypothetical protein